MLNVQVKAFPCARNTVFVILKRWLTHALLFTTDLASEMICYVLSGMYKTVVTQLSLQRLSYSFCSLPTRTVLSVDTCISDREQPFPQPHAMAIRPTSFALGLYLNGYCWRVTAFVPQPSFADYAYASLQYSMILLPISHRAV